MRMLRIIAPACALMVLLAACPGTCWGPPGHETTMRHTIELMPKEIKPFYEENSRCLVALVMLPDDWRFEHGDEMGDQHYINFEMLGAPPYDSLVMDRASAEKKFGKEKIKEAGTLPWAIEDRWNRLVKAFKEGDTTGIVVQSAVLGHYIGDAHVPLHNTKFHDGRTPEQKGIHFHWETNIQVLFLKPESIKPQSPEDVNDILKSAFKWCIASNGYVDAIYKAADKARLAHPGTTYAYFQSLYQDTSSILQGQLSDGARATAGAIIAAWKAAGKPELKGEPADLFWGK